MHSPQFYENTDTGIKSGNCNDPAPQADVITLMHTMRIGDAYQLKPSRTANMNTEG